MFLSSAGDPVAKHWQCKVLKGVILSGLMKEYEPLQPVEFTGFWRWLNTDYEATYSSKLKTGRPPEAVSFKDKNEKIWWH